MKRSIMGQLLSSIGFKRPEADVVKRHRDGAQPALSQDGQLAFWKQQFTDIPPVLDLPLDRSRPYEAKFCDAVETLEIPFSTTEVFKGLAQKNDSTLAVPLIAAYFVLLYRYTGQEDIVVTCPVQTPGIRAGTNNNDDAGQSDNVIFLRMELNVSSSFNVLLTQLRQTMQDAQANSNIHYEEILKAVVPESGRDFSPFFQIGFSLDAVFQSPSLWFAQKVRDLHLAINDKTQGLEVQLHYSHELLDAATARRLLGHYENILNSVAANPTQPISQLPLLSNAERRQILIDWNDSETGFPILNSVHELFEGRVAKAPDAIALAFKGAHISYRELNERSNHIAHYLRSLGVTSGKLVGVYMDRCIDAVVAIVGVLKAGGAYLPLDASYPAERLSYIMNDAQAQILLTHQRHTSAFAQPVDKVVCLDSDWPMISQHSQNNPANHTERNDDAFILYTSGSMGNPKGVQVTHANLVNYFFAWEHTQKLRTSISSVCQMAFFSFAVFQGDVVRALCAGKKLVLCPREVLMSPRKLFELMQQEKVDFAEFVPTLLRALLGYLKDAGKSIDFMKVVIVGADRWYVREHKEVQTFCGPETNFIHVYGLSETTLDSTYFTSTNTDLSDDQLVPIGRPFPNVKVYLLDSNLEPVPIGVNGEICIGGAGLAKGYYRHPELTAEKFVLAPFAEEQGERIYRTGDLGQYLVDGNIAYLGRRDQQVKVRGFRVELGEIESHLDNYPGIEAAIVQPWEPKVGVTHLVAYYVAASALGVKTEELMQFLSEELPEFMIPSHFVMLDSLPLTPSGKVNRNALPLPVSEPQGNESGEMANEPESTIAAICKHAMGSDSLRSDENFVSKGGDSMAIITMVSGLENAFGIDIEEDDINLDVFANINSLTRYVEEKLNG